MSPGLEMMWEGDMERMGADLGELCLIRSPVSFLSATSTFWMANPNNNLINCAAAGSEVGAA